MLVKLPIHFSKLFCLLLMLDDFFLESLVKLCTSFFIQNSNYDPLEYDRICFILYGSLKFSRISTEAHVSWELWPMMNFKHCWYLSDEFVESYLTIEIGINFLEIGRYTSQYFVKCKVSFFFEIRTFKFDLTHVFSASMLLTRFQKQNILVTKIRFRWQIMP